MKTITAILKSINDFFDRQEQAKRESHLAGASNLCDLEQRITELHRR